MPYGIAKLSYEVWDEYVYIGGMLIILKKHIALEAPWNETRYWGELEDVELTFRQRDLGFLARFNPYSSVEALSWRFGDLPSKYYPSQGLLPKDMLLRRFMRQINRILFSNQTSRKFLSPLVLGLMRIRLFRFLIDH